MPPAIVAGVRGFTIVEVLVAVLVLALGVLGLVTTQTLITRLLGQGWRAETAAAFASQRLERGRHAACRPGLRVAGTEVLYRGTGVAARNTWYFNELDGGRAVRVRVVTEAVVMPGRSRTDTLETDVPCPI
jgi:prepilin-type N-terminal cleavage/methylation domain-containing protein